MKPRVAPYLFLLPALIAVGAIILLPLVQTVFYSMTNFNPAVSVPLTTGLHIERNETTGDSALIIDEGGPAARAGITPETSFEGLLIPPDPNEASSNPRIERFRGPAERRLQPMRRALDRAERRILDYPPNERHLTLFVTADDGSREVVIPYEPADVRRVPPPDLGITAAHIDSENRWQLVVRDGLPAHTAGIASNDVVVAIQGEPLRSMEDFDSQLAATLEQTQGSGGTITLELERDGATRTVSLPGHRGAFTLDPPPAAQSDVLSFIGFQNYKRILVPSEYSNEAHDFYRYLIHTVIWTFTNVVLHFVLGLGLALLLNREIRGRVIYRIILMLPWAVPVFVSAFVWRFLFNQQGVINAGLAHLGIDAIPWLSSTSWTMTACIVVNVWLGVPFMMVVLLGGLQTIPEEMYEAARVDGASKWQQFWNVTMPLLKPVAVTATLLGVIWTFNMFNVIYLMQGREGRQVEILATLAFRRFYVNTDYGLAAAYGVLILAMLLAFAFVYIRTLRANEKVW